MKLNLTLAAAALAATVAVPAFADSSAQRVIEHINMSADGYSDRIPVGPNGPVLGTTVSTRGDRALEQAIAIYNASTDSAAERIDVNTVSDFSGAPTHAAEIFEQLRLADDSN